jgi:hypothetical protein
MCTALDTERPYRIRPRTIIDFRGPVPEHSNDITGCFVDPANADVPPAPMQTWQVAGYFLGKLLIFVPEERAATITGCHP